MKQLRYYRIQKRRRRRRWNKQTEQWAVSTHKLSFSSVQQNIIVCQIKYAKNSTYLNWAHSFQLTLKQYSNEICIICNRKQKCAHMTHTTYGSYKKWSENVLLFFQNHYFSSSNREQLPGCHEMPWDSIRFFSIKKSIEHWERTNERTKDKMKKSRIKIKWLFIWAHGKSLKLSDSLAFYLFTLFNQAPLIITYLFNGVICCFGGFFLSFLFLLNVTKLYAKKCKFNDFQSN